MRNLTIHFIKIFSKKQMKEVELVGWVAVAVVLANQILAQVGFLKNPKNIQIFMGLNLVGATLLFFTALMLNFMPLIVLESAIIALGMFRFLQALFK